MSWLTRRLLAVFAFILGVYLVLAFFRYKEGQGGALYTCWLMSPRAQTDDFSSKLEEAIGAQGFRRSGPPAPSSDVYTEWFYGSFEGSPPFYVSIFRDGPERQLFHLQYEWNRQAYSSSFKLMDAHTDAFAAFLKKWSETRGVHDQFTRN